MSSIETAIDREISATTRWGVGLLIGLIAQTCGIVYWASQLQSQVKQNTYDINKLSSRVDDVDTDIRTILIGIEQVKARLGIVEIEK